MNKTDELCVNTLRFLAVDAVEKAKSGHPGLPLGAAPIAYVVWDRFLRHSPGNPSWFNRDRFILSAGHGSMLLYSLLYLTGDKQVTLDDAVERELAGTHVEVVVHHLVGLDDDHVAEPNGTSELQVVHRSRDRGTTTVSVCGDTGGDISLRENETLHRRPLAGAGVKQEQTTGDQQSSEITGHVVPP